MQNRSKQNTHYLYILNNDRKLSLCTVSCQQILTVAGEGEELVVKGLEVRLAHHQALTYSTNKAILAEMMRKLRSLFTSRIYKSACASLSPGQPSLVHSQEP